MIRPILEYPNEALRQGARPVEEFDAALAALIRDMFETMRAAKGAGLAAPQIGVDLRVIVVDAQGHRLALVNPVIVTGGGGSASMLEGCLSFPGFREQVVRHPAIGVRYLTEKGLAQGTNCGGFLAQVIQHEIDHLNGVLLIDHLDPVRKKKIHKAMMKKEGR